MTRAANSNLPAPPPNPHFTAWCEADQDGAMMAHARIVADDFTLARAAEIFAIEEFGPVSGRLIDQLLCEARMKGALGRDRSAVTTRWPR